MSGVNDMMQEEDAAVVAELEACISDFTDYLDDDPTVPRLHAVVSRLKEFHLERYGMQL